MNAPTEIEVVQVGWNSGQVMGRRLYDRSEMHAADMCARYWSRVHPVYMRIGLRISFVFKWGAKMPAGVNNV
jgi:hypothetical protein